MALKGLWTNSWLHSETTDHTMPPVRTETHERMRAALPALRAIQVRGARRATLLHLTAKKLHALQRAMEKATAAAAGAG